MKLLHILLPDNLIKRIDDFRYSHRFESRAAAVRALIESALEDYEDIDAALEDYRKNPSDAVPLDEYLAKHEHLDSPQDN